MQPELPLFQKNIPSNKEQILKIPGLSYYPEYISQKEEKLFSEEINSTNWQKDIKRFTQHYGFQYDYRARSVDYSMRIGSLPDWSLRLVEKLVADKIFEEAPDQLLINNYKPGQGIAPHTDCEPCFLDTIVSISMGSTAIIEFSKDKLKIPIFLEQRSMVVLKGEARYDWKHGIPARKKDIINGEVFPRERRMSLTFRKVIVD